MEKRTKDLLELRSYTDDIDKDLTMILQSLQWDRKYILQDSILATCSYDLNHRILVTKEKDHEEKCLLRHNGYTPQDILLPDPPDTGSNTLVKLSKQDIAQILENASKLDPTFKKGIGSGEIAPQTLGRLQCAYSSDERRAIHDAVVSAAPSCHDLTDLALPSISETDQAPKIKSRTEILAELRDMRRRRTKYRVAAKSSNYSNVLRDVIKTQMEVYVEALDVKPNITEQNATNKQHDDKTQSIDDDKHTSEHDKHRRDRFNGERTERRQDEQQRDRRSRGSSRDRIKYSRSSRDSGRYKDIKDEGMEDDTASRYRNRQVRDEKGKERHKETGHDQYRKTYNKDYNRSGKDRDRKRYHTKEKERYNERQREYSDGERARNLINEIKREIEDNNESNGNNASTSSIDIKANKQNSYERKERESHRNKERTDYSKERRNLERADKDRNRDHKRNRERQYEERRESNRVGDRKREFKEETSNSHNFIKKSRAEDKHKLYSEIYSELNKKK